METENQISNGRPDVEFNFGEVTVLELLNP